MNYNLNNPIAKRSTKTIYRDGEKAIKLFVENYSKADILNEALNQARVEEHTSLNIPNLIEVAKIENCWAIVSDFVEGKTLAELMEENPERTQEYLEKMVDIQLEVLSYKVPLLNRVKDKYKRKINEADLSENVKYELLTRLEGMKNHTKLCHGDFNPSNIVIKEDGSHHIIDWAHVTSGNASSDVALTYLYFAMKGKEDIASQYLTMFSTKSGIDVKNIQRWIPIVAVTKLAKASPAEKEFLNNCINVAEYQ